MHLDLFFLECSSSPSILTNGGFTPITGPYYEGLTLTYTCDVDYSLVNDVGQVLDEQLIQCQSNGDFEAFPSGTICRKGYYISLSFLYKNAILQVLHSTNVWLPNITKSVN